MKYFIFALVFLTGCLSDSESSLLEEDEIESEVIEESSPIVYGVAPYRMSCGESILKTDVLGNKYYIPILCQDFFLDKGRPADRTFIGNEIVNDVSQPMTIVAQPFSDFDS